MPVPSVMTWCFEPVRARSTGLGPVQLVRGVQLGQQQFVQLLPHPGLVPLGEPPPAGHAGAEPEFLRQELPRDRRVKHEQDPAQHLPIRQSFPTGIAEVPLVLR